MRLEDRVAIITGAGSGIGRESALLFAQEGAQVVVVDIVKEAGRETADLIGENAFFIKVDVSSWADTERMVSTTVERFGRIDILFSNAGINLPQRASVVETAEADWDRIMAVNLKGVFLGARHALPVMMAQGSGVIVNTASTAGIGASPRLAAYCASKGGVVSLTRQLAVDYAPYNIRVNAICPGALEKPVAAVHAAFLQTPGALEERNRQIAQRVPLRKLGVAKDVAYAALYLASDESAHVTGIALIVDGGNHAL
jgi:NAD(P)-dependent dehydrogenase (short-subunit alcohol dehydrogenase family)